MDSSSIENLCAAILAYLHRHPKSADTLDGIHAWWLPRELALHPKQTEQALELLVSREELECVPVGNRKIFRRPQHHA